MTILNSPDWEDIPDKRKVIALLGMMQIMEDDMHNLAVRAFVEKCKKIITEGDLQTTKSESVETLEHCVVQLDYELSATKEKLKEEMENHAQLQSRCYDQGGTFSNVFDELSEVRREKRKMEKEIERLNGLLSMQAEALVTCKEIVINADYSNGNFVEQRIKTFDSKLVNSSLSASSDTVAAYKREVQAEALEKAASQFEEQDEQLLVDENMQHTYAIRLRAMASELRAKGEE